MVVLQQVGQDWIPATLTGFKDEKHLQKIVKATPRLIPGCEGRAVADELSVPSVGNADLVLVGAAGDVTVVECKLQANREIRREVVGQVLAYAGGLWKTDVDAFVELWHRRTNKSLVDDVRAATGAEFDESVFRDGLTATLQEGSFRLVIAVDQITPELRSITEFLNHRTDTDFEFFVLELGLLNVGKESFLVPQGYGADLTFFETGPVKKGRKPWAVAVLLERLGEVSDPASLIAVEKLLAHAKTYGATFKGGTGEAPSGGYYYQLSGAQRSLWSIYARDEGPVIALNFGSVDSADPLAAKRAVETAYSIPALGKFLSGDHEADAKRYPTVAVSTLVADGADGADLMSVLDSALNVTASDVDRSPLETEPDR